MSDISARDRAAAVVAALHALRQEVAATLARVDAAIVEAEAFIALADNVIAVTTDLAGHAPDARERAYLRPFGKHGATVVRIAEEHGVPLGDLLGPGAPPTVKALAARDAAAGALMADGQCSADIARALRISPEAARLRVASRPVSERKRLDGRRTRGDVADRNRTFGTGAMAPSTRRPRGSLSLPKKG